MRFTGSLGGGIDLALVWQICLLAIIVMVLLVIPFCIFYYEAMDPDAKCGGVCAARALGEVCLGS